MSGSELEGTAPSVPEQEIYYSTDRAVPSKMSSPFRRFSSKDDLLAPGAVTHQQISDYLAHKKRLGLSAASIKLIVVALKIFFRWLHARKRIERDVAEVLPLPRTERFLPETMNELQVDQLLEGVPINAPRGRRDRALLEL